MTTLAFCQVASLRWETQRSNHWKGKGGDKEKLFDDKFKVIGVTFDLNSLTEFSSGSCQHGGARRERVCKHRRRGSQRDAAVLWQLRMDESRWSSLCTRSP